MLDLRELSQQALYYYQRDGFQKFDLGYDNKPHCVGGLINLALSNGETVTWQQYNHEAAPVYDKLFDIMTETWPEVYASVRSKFGEVEPVPGVGWGNSRVDFIAHMNNDDLFHEAYVPVLFSKLAES